MLPQNRQERHASSSCGLPVRQYRRAAQIG
jgi:hypothetical protein